jgi:hypothetical protein
MDEEIRKRAAELLNQIPPHEPLGTALFNAVMRHSVGIAFEGVALRKGERGETEVFIALRGPDEAYPNQWHVPGTFFRIGEYETDVARRLSAKEYGVPIVNFELVKDNFLPEERGETILDRIYLVDLESPPKEGRGKWCDVEDLPENIVQSHRHVIIPTAVAFWLRRR